MCKHVVQSETEDQNNSSVLVVDFKISLLCVCFVLLILQEEGKNLSVMDLVLQMSSLSCWFS